MKKIIFIIALFTFAGCMRTTLTYQDEHFTLEYPSNWTVTKSHNEIQFWDQEEAIKMALFQADDIDFIAERSLDEAPIMIRTGKFMSDFQIYYYDLGDEIIGFSAYFEASTPGHKEQVTQVQESFRATN